MRCVGSASTFFAGQDAIRDGRAPDPRRTHQPDVTILDESHAFYVQRRSADVDPNALAKMSRQEGTTLDWRGVVPLPNDPQPSRRNASSTKRGRR